MGHLWDAFARTYHGVIAVRERLAGCAIPAHVARELAELRRRMPGCDGC